MPGQTLDGDFRPGLAALAARNRDLGHPTRPVIFIDTGTLGAFGFDGVLGFKF